MITNAFCTHAWQGGRRGVSNFSLFMWDFRVFSMSLEAQFDKWKNEERAYYRLMKVKLNGAILLKQLIYSAYLLNLPQLPFASRNAICLVEICVCPKEIVMSFDFNIGSLSPLFLHLTSVSWVVEWEKVILVGRLSQYENDLVWQSAGDFGELCSFVCDCPVSFGN